MQAELSGNLHDFKWPVAACMGMACTSHAWDKRKGRLLASQLVSAAGKKPKYRRRLHAGLRGGFVHRSVEASASPSASGEGVCGGLGLGLVACSAGFGQHLRLNYHRKSHYIYVYAW